MATTPKITIAMAASDYIRTQTTGMLVSLFKARPDMRLIIKQGPYVHHNREQCVDDFLQTDSTHLFFVDSDMLFKPEVLDALLAHDKDIVGVQYYRRNGRDGIPVVNTRYDLPGTNYPNHLFKQYPLATGCLLIKKEVFSKIPKPWFTVGLAEAWVGEDVFFSRRAKEYGVEMWLDPTQEIYHIGEWLYKK